MRKFNIFFRSKVPSEFQRSCWVPSVARCSLLKWETIINQFSPFNYFVFGVIREVWIRLLLLFNYKIIYLRFIIKFKVSVGNVNQETETMVVKLFTIKWIVNHCYDSVVECESFSIFLWLNFVPRVWAAHLWKRIFFSALPFQVVN